MQNKQFIIPAFIVTVIVLTLMLPATELFKLSYRNGGTWQHADVVAPFDFPILKKESVYNADIEDAKSRFVPIYNFETNVARKMEQGLHERINTILTSEVNDSLRRNITNEVIANISTIYNKGIIDNNNTESDKNSETLVVRVIKDGAISNSSFKNFYSLEQAKYLAKKSLNNTPLLRELQVENYITPNITYNEELNSREKSEIIASIPNSNGFIRQGSKIIERGETITDEIYNKLYSLEKEAELRSENQNSVVVLIGNLLYVIIIMALSFMFMRIISKDFFNKVGNIYFILFLFLLMTTFSMVVSKISWLNIYLIPFAVVPFYVLNFYNIRVAIFVYVSILLTCSIFAPEPIDFFFINLVAGLAGVFTLQNSYHRKKIFSAVGIMLFAYLMSYTSISFMKSLSVSILNWKTLVWFVINILIFLGMYQIMFIFEKIFGFVTNISLLELCDTNRRVLRMLAKKAPGTYQHSVQVANLAEAAAKEIDANPLLARAGSLYHDIGKMENPTFFTENNFNTTNTPHNNISDLESAEKIRNHVRDGVKLANKYNLPPALVDFITSHHAKSLIYFFYHSYKRNNPNGVVDESLFRYNGQNPTSKELTICMMADSIEAAARSLKEHTPKAISNLVENIVKTQIKEGNFSDSDITLAEVERVKAIFKRKIAGIYHSRISYPERE